MQAVLALAFTEPSAHRDPPLTLLALQLLHAWAQASVINCAALAGAGVGGMLTALAGRGGWVGAEGQESDVVGAEDGTAELQLEMCRYAWSCLPMAEGMRW
jgi:hypothetical protein